MSISFQTNYAALVAENNLNTNNNFQTSTIEALTSGYRINSSGDDAAGLAVANQYQASINTLTEGVLNGNAGVSALQIADGGLSNITTILDRLQTLASESASTTFTGNRQNINVEYQQLVSQISQQADNIGLGAGGSLNVKNEVYIGGGNTQANSQIQVDLSGAINQVDANGLGLANTSVLGGGTELSGQHGASGRSGRELPERQRDPDVHIQPEPGRRGDPCNGYRDRYRWRNQSEPGFDPAQQPIGAIRYHRGGRQRRTDQFWRHDGLYGQHNDGRCDRRDRNDRNQRQSTMVSIASPAPAPIPRKSRR